jgi:hypothetical protein
LDAACLYIGRTAQKAIDDGKEPFKSSKPQGPQQFQDPRKFKKVVTVKRKPDGTW